MKKCLHCKEYYKNELCVTFNRRTFCSYDHAVLYAQNTAQKAKEKIARKETRQAKQKNKTIAQLAKESQTEFNKFIRLRDKDLPCISCGRHHQGQYHAGHYLSTKAHPELRFNELNVHKQCSTCNNHLSGNLINYRKNLINKIGLDQVEFLEGFHETKKRSREELLFIKQTYKEKARHLTKT